MTKYRKIEKEVYATKEQEQTQGKDGNRNKLLNDQIEEHVEELICMAEIAVTFLTSHFAEKGNEEVEKGRRVCLERLERGIKESIELEKTWKAWEANWIVLDRLNEAVYELGLVCKPFLTPIRVVEE